MLQEMEEEDDVSAAVLEGPNSISIGIQTKQYKRPGRKRKNRELDNTNPAATVADITQRGAYTDVGVAAQGEFEEGEGEIRQRGAEGDEEYDGFEEDLLLVSRRKGKRRVRLPQALLSDYHVGSKKYKDRLLSLDDSTVPPMEEAAVELAEAAGGEEKVKEEEDKEDQQLQAMKDRVICDIKVGYFSLLACLLKMKSFC